MQNQNSPQGSWTVVVCRDRSKSRVSVEYGCVADGGTPLRGSTHPFAKHSSRCEPGRYRLRSPSATELPPLDPSRHNTWVENPNWDKKRLTQEKIENRHMQVVDGINLCSFLRKRIHVIDLIVWEIERAYHSWFEFKSWFSEVALIKKFILKQAGKRALANLVNPLPDYGQFRLFTTCIWGKARQHFAHKSAEKSCYCQLKATKLGKTKSIKFGA